jgi:hypothetical protein
MILMGHLQMFPNLLPGAGSQGNSSDGMATGELLSCCGLGAAVAFW